MDTKVVARNVAEPPVEVEYYGLERTHPGRWASKCPICKGGVLLVHRNNETLEILAQDNCMLCGRRFVYTDVGEMRKMDRGGS